MTKENSEDKTSTYRPLAKGTMVSHYQINSKIGAGGMGEVYLAEDCRLARRVAIKFLPAHSCENAELRARFIREAKAAAKLNHPNIVTVYEVDEYEGRPFYSMEYVEGEDLQQLIKRGKLTLERITEIIKQGAEALAEAHENGIVHRDIKPANIVFDRSDRPRLVDFGLAAMHGNDAITRPQTTMGTFAYISPEQARGEVCDGRSDLFSLGVVWYEMITGGSPFARESSAATLQAILNFDPARPDFKDIPLSDDHWNLMRRLLAKSTEDRLQSAAELVEGLKGTSSEPGSSDVSLKSIAILPFANMSEDPSQEHFCDGIAEDIINDLTKLEGLRVVARTSSFAFKGKNEDMRLIGRRLDVQVILEGSVRKVGQRVRVTAQLIKVADGFHLWSERYDREINDIFAIQDDIVNNVVGKLIGILQPTAHKTPTRQVDIGAYEAYSRGRYHLRRRDAEGFNAAITSFREAIALQRDYVHGFIGLADAYFLQYAYELADPRDTIARARSYLLRALEIDPNVAEAYTTLGGILTFHDWAWEEAEAAFKKSLELNPGYSVGHQWYGELLSVLGRIDEAEAQLKRARELDPMADIIYIMHGVALYVAGRNDEAISMFQEAISIGSTNENAYCWLGYIQIDQGDITSGLANMQKGRECSGNTVFSSVMHAHACYLAGDIDGARMIAAEVMERSAKDYLSPALRAVLAFDSGDKESAHHWMKEAIRCHNSEVMIMSVVPYYREMQNDSTIRTLLSITGLIR